MFGHRKRPSRQRTDSDLRCSFCYKSQNDVRKLIAGPTVFICDECVAVCNDIRSTRPDGPALPMPLNQDQPRAHGWRHGQSRHRPRFRLAKQIPSEAENTRHIR
jgi:hypothetical protein